MVGCLYRPAGDPVLGLHVLSLEQLMSNKDGGPAFPDPQEDWCGEKGMSLRDYFANSALNGMLANQHPYQASDESMFARDSYVLADAMLKERDK